MKNIFNYLMVVFHKLVNKSSFGIAPQIGIFSKVVNTKAGKFCYVGNYTRIHSTFIGDFFVAGPNCLIGLGRHPKDYSHPVFHSNEKYYVKLRERHGIDMKYQKFEDRRSIIIGDNVWIGAGSLVLDGVSIGDNCVIGAGSVISKSVPANSIVVTNKMIYV